MTMMQIPHVELESESELEDIEADFDGLDALNGEDYINSSEASAMATRQVLKDTA